MSSLPRNSLASHGQNPNERSSARHFPRSCDPLPERNADLRSIDDASWHIDLLDRWIGELALEDVCDDTLGPFKIHRREVDGVGVTTVAERSSASGGGVHERDATGTSWGFANVRVHDLKHTFGRRLRSAGVREETRKVLLGHKNGDITVHYSAVEIRELIEAVERIDTSRETPVITLLRVPGRGESLAEVERKKQRADRIGPKSLKFGAPGRI